VDDARETANAVKPVITFLARRRQACSVGFFAVFGIAVCPTSGRECVAVPACDALKSASIVLVADVVAADQPAVRIDESHAHMIPQRVRLRVVERFKGVSAERRELQANIAIRSAEAVFLANGQRYLIYARMREDGTWDTACSGTKPIEAAGEDLKQLRQCRLRSREIREVDQPELADQESYAVYATVVERAINYKSDPILIGDLTLAHPRRCVPRVSPDLPAWREAAEDFVRRSGSRLRLARHLPLTTRYRLVSSTDLGHVTRIRKGGIVRYVEFSAVGFDVQRTRAMVQRDHKCANAFECADGATIFLQKESGAWRVVSPEGVSSCVWTM
jgi:hypothetical protein